MKVLLALLLTISYCPKIWNNSKLFFQKCRGQKIGVKSLIIWTTFFYRLSMPVKGVLTPVTPVGMKPKWLYARGGVRNTFQFACKKGGEGTKHFIAKNGRGYETFLSPKMGRGYETFYRQKMGVRNIFAISHLGVWNISHIFWAGVRNIFGCLDQNLPAGYAG